MLKIKIDDLNINYKQTGNGSDVVLLHGWGQNIEMMEPIGNRIKDKRVTIIDFLGFGNSDEPKEAMTVYDYTDLLEKLFVKLNISNPILIGHSFGGRIAIIYATRNKTKKIVLIDSAGIKPKRTIKYYLMVYTYKIVSKIFKLPIFNIYENDIKKLFGSTDYKNVSGVMQKTLVNIVNEDLTHLLKKIECETLLLWGEKDDATPVGDAYLMNKLIPNTRLFIYKDRGHYMYLDEISDVSKKINNFIGDCND